MSWNDPWGPTVFELWRYPEARLLFLCAGAAWLGLAVYALARAAQARLARRSWRGRLTAFLAGREGDRFEALGNSVLRRLPEASTHRWLEAFRRQQRWIALEGASASLPRMMGVAVLLLTLGALGFAQRTPAFFLVGCAGALYPFVRLRGQVRRIQRRTERALPELLSLMAAEMTAGVPADRALQRAGEFGGPLAALIQQAVRESRRARRPLFGRGTVAGTWRRVAERYDLPSLRAFAIQIDIAARKGAAGPELMESLSRALILAYKDQALREVEKFESRLAVPSVLFFFLPLMALVLTPLLMPLLQALA